MNCNDRPDVKKKYAMNKGKFILKALLGGILFLLLFGFITMTLWNWLIPLLFNGPHVRFIEALGLLLLAKILFGGWGKPWQCRGGGPAHWKYRYAEKLSKMTAEERERFKARMSEKWCSGPKPATGAKDEHTIH